MSRIAVVVPAFNRSDLLCRALLSVAGQTRPAEEVVIVDDASDRDLAAARRIAEEAGFHWVALPRNSGPAAARNRGVDETEAEWICFLDSDDEWLPEKLAVQDAWHRSRPEIGISQVVETWIRDGNPVAKPEPWRQREGGLFEASVERCSIGPSCIMMRRTLWNESGGFDERFRVCEDYELWLRITGKHPVGLVGNEPLVRKHGGRGDQLSVATPAMDRFRVVALLEVLRTGGLPPGRDGIVRAGIRARASILAKGAAKRGLGERAAFYRELERRCVEEFPFDPVPFLGEAWRHTGDEEGSRPDGGCVP